MIVIYLVLALLLFHKAKRPLTKRVRFNITGLVLFAIITMIAYEFYVEYAVGWKNGIPYSDDTGWIYRAAEAMSKGMGWDKLAGLVMNPEWNTSRNLAFETLGQYLYATLVSGALFFPTIINIHVNLYVWYFVQILLAATAILDFILAIGEFGVYKTYNCKPKKTLLFGLLLFYPVVIFNTYKLLRETIFLFLILEAFSSFVKELSGKKKKSFVFYAIAVVLIRPNSLLILFPMIIWIIFGEKVAWLATTLVNVLFVFGIPILIRMASIIGIYNISLSTISASKIIYFLAFPNPFHQFKLFLGTFSQPSEVVLLYLAQSIGNIPFIILCVLGMIKSMQRRKNGVWIMSLFNTVLLYALSPLGLTPRYKLFYLIPEFIFVYVEIEHRAYRRYIKNTKQKEIQMEFIG